MAELLSAEEIEARIKGLPAPYAYVRPLAEAAESYIDFTQNPTGRFMLGIPEVDAMTRGFGKGELAYVTGRAHAGKTQVVLNALVHNPKARILWFTPDEVAELILVKLVALAHGVDAEEIEYLVKNKDAETVELVRHVAAEQFRNLVIVDASLSFSQMWDALVEARKFWGADADAVVVDFLELLLGDGEGTEGVQAKSQAMKRWTKNANVPVVCLHQASRGSAPRGQAGGMGSMRYGGENDAIFVLEVYRKREDDSLEDRERSRHENTVTVNVCKNKRPPCHVGEVDLYLDPTVGRIRPLRPNDITPTKKLDQLLKQAQQSLMQRTLTGLERAQTYYESQAERLHNNDVF